MTATQRLRSLVLSGCASAPGQFRTVAPPAELLQYPKRRNVSAGWVNVENGVGMEALLSFVRLAETILRISIKLVLIFVAFFVALVAALVWKK